MRTTRLSVWDPIALVSIAAAAVATWTVYDRLPDPMPTHFDLHGQPNGWMPRAWGAWFAPALALAVWLVVRLAPKILPRRDRLNLKGDVVPLVAMMTTVFLAAVQLLIVRFALGAAVNVTQMAFAFVSLLFIGLGLVMPRVRRNPIIGIRTRWTLTSDENWARTHRVAGYVMVGGGIVAGIGAIVGGPAGLALGLVAIVGASVIPMVWSLVYARRHDA